LPKRNQGGRFGKRRVKLGTSRNEEIKNNKQTKKGGKKKKLADASNKKKERDFGD